MLENIRNAITLPQWTDWDANWVGTCDEVLCLVVSLSCVCLSVLFHCRQRLQLSRNICALPNSSGTRTVSVVIWAKILWIVQVKYNGYGNWRFRPISRFISKMVQDTAMVYNGRRIGTRM